MLSPSSRDWVTDPGRIGRVGSFSVSLNGSRVLHHTGKRPQLVCVIPEHLDIKPEIVELLAHVACQHQAKLANASISTKAYFKLVSSLLPATMFGQKMKPDLPCDAKQIVMLSHLGARCDGETSSARRGFELELRAPGAVRTKASAFVPAARADDQQVWRSAANVALREILAGVPSTKYDRAAALSAAHTQHLFLVQ